MKLKLIGFVAYVQLKPVAVTLLKKANSLARNAYTISLYNYHTLKGSDTRWMGSCGCY